MKKELARLIMVGMLLGLLATPSYAASTSVSQNINPGILSLTSQPSAQLSDVTVDATKDQTANGSLGAITATDSRGTGAGWTVTASATNFSKINTSRVAGSGGNMSAGGSYSGSASGAYTITISSGGSLGTANFTVSGLHSQGATITGSSVPIDSGIVLSFGNGVYTTGDQWTIDVSSLSVANLTLTPSAVAAIGTASTSGVINGSAHTFVDPNDTMTVMHATAGNGLGQYTDDPGVSLKVPAGTRAGSYSATITETIN